MYKDRLKDYFLAHKDALLADVSTLVAINSEDMPPEPGMPYGRGPAQCLAAAQTIQLERKVKKDDRKERRQERKDRYAFRKIRNEGCSHDSDARILARHEAETHGNLGAHTQPACVDP